MTETTPDPVQVDRRGGAWSDGTGMPGWIPRLLVMVFGTIVGLWAAFNVLSRLRGLFILVAISLFLSIALEPGVNYLAKRGWRRGLATGVMFLGVLVVTALFIGLMVPLIVDQTIKADAGKVFPFVDCLTGVQLRILFLMAICTGFTQYIDPFLQVRQG